MTPTLFGLLVEAALYTVAISVVSILIGFCIGMGVSAARLSPNPWLAVSAREQKLISQAIKRARHMALLPYTNATL